MKGIAVGGQGETSLLEMATKSRWRTQQRRGPDALGRRATACDLAAKTPPTVSRDAGLGDGPCRPATAARPRPDPPGPRRAARFASMPARGMVSTPSANWWGWGRGSPPSRRTRRGRLIPRKVMVVSVGGSRLAPVGGEAPLLARLVGGLEGGEGEQVAGLLVGGGRHRGRLAGGQGWIPSTERRWRFSQAPTVVDLRRELAVGCGAHPQQVVDAPGAGGDVLPSTNPGSRKRALPLGSEVCGLLPATCGQ